MKARTSEQATLQRVSLPIYESLRTRAQDGHQIELHESGNEFFPALVAAIEAARDSVFVETYIFHDDGEGRRIALALAEAANRGVAVHLIVDGFGTPRLDGEIGRVLRQAPVRTQVFRPERGRLWLDRRRLRRLHRKLVVIDGTIAFVGGINLLDDHEDPNHGRLESPRLDFAVQVRGPLVAYAHVAAQRLWHELSLINASLRKGSRVAGAESDAALVELSQRILQSRTVSSDVTPVGNMRAQFAVRDNFRHRRSIERWYLRRIAQARVHVTIANAYFLPGAKFRRALRLAAQRGVHVTLLLQGRVEYRLQYHASQSLYEDLLRAGVEIFEYRRSFLHAKVASIDHHATVGSSNIDPFSLLLAREANVFIENAGFSDQLRRRIESAIQRDGEAVVLERVRRRPWYQRVINRAAFSLLRLAVAVTGQGDRY